jgi:hypothetical protein
MGLDPSSRQHPLATIGPAALVLDAGHNSYLVWISSDWLISIQFINFLII